MSAEEMRRLTIDKLSEMRENGVDKLRRMRHERPTVAKIEGALVTLPGNTAESIGIIVCEINAELNAVDRAIEIVNDTFRRLMAPPPDPAAVDEEKPTEELYG